MSHLRNNFNGGIWIRGIRGKIVEIEYNICNISFEIPGIFVFSLYI